jgi:hypothetical protein
MTRGIAVSDIGRLLSMVIRRDEDLARRARLALGCLPPAARAARAGRHSPHRSPHRSRRSPRGPGPGESLSAGGDDPA